MELQNSIRAQSGVSHPGRRAARHATMHLVALQLAGRDMALHAEEVREVLLPAALTPLPQLGGDAEGTLNLRGQVLLVFDLRRLLGVEARPWTRRTRIVLAQGPSSLLGLIVDGVSDVVEASTADVSPPPQSALGISAHALTGVLRTDSGVVPILSVARLIDALSSSAMPGKEAIPNV